MKIFVFGSSITSCYWNGAATYYRGIYKNLNALGHRVTFAEPDIYERQKKRDVGTIDYAEVLVYQAPADIEALLEMAREADLVIKHSGVGAADELLEREVLACRSAKTRVIFWDVDAPATLSRVEHAPDDSFRDLISEYDAILTYGGGPPVVDHYLRLGAKQCHPIYNAVDPDTHFPVRPDPSLECDLAFVGHCLPDRLNRVKEFFFRSAELAPDMKFVLGGEGWCGIDMPSNVEWIGHVASADHNRVNCSARMILNLNRDSMADVGFSPPTRVFEAGGAGACVVTDHWKGIELFFEPGKEILVANSADEIVAGLRGVDRKAARDMGNAMRQRALKDHTYAMRVREVDEIITKLGCDRGSEQMRSEAELAQT